MCIVLSVVLYFVGEWGKSTSSTPNREIGFGFVSCSCRACERAGKAKLRGRVSDVPPQRWGPERQLGSLRRVLPALLFDGIVVFFCFGPPSHTIAVGFLAGI